MEFCGVVGNVHWLLFVLASWMRVTLGYQLLVRMPIRVRENMVEDVDLFSYVVAAFKCFATPAGNCAASFAADYFARGRPRPFRTRIVLVLVVTITAAPFLVLSSLARNFVWFCVGLFFYYFLGESWLGPALTASTEMIPKEQTSTATALFLGSANLFGGTVITVQSALGLDHGTGLDWSMVTIALSATAISTVCWLWLTRAKSLAKIHQAQDGLAT